MMSKEVHSRSFISNSGFIFVLGLVAGLGFGQGAPVTKPAVIPVLGLIMTLSVLEISSSVFGSLRKTLSGTVISSTLSYGVLSGALIGLSYLLVGDVEIYAGFVILAAVPPAVAVIPFTFQLGGDIEVSLVGETGAYFVALLVTPLISVALLGANVIDPIELLIILGGMIVGPLLLSRVLRKTPLVEHLNSWRKPVIDWGFFLLIYTMIGLNRDELLHQPQELIGVFLVCFIATFVLAELIVIGTAFLGIGRSHRISFLLLSTRKNDGLAGAIALTLFGSRVAIPAAVFGAVGILQFVWLNWRVGRLV